jgi:hypothetical protein
MAGAGTRLFEAGSILTANQVNTYLMDQVVARFATLGDRDAAFGGGSQPALSEGRLCYLDSTNKVYIYTGSAWEEIGSQIEAGEVGTTELADSAVTTAKILNGTILNEDISSSASIALSKLATGALPAAITVASANIVDGTIVNADINAAAAIALSKLATGTSGQIVVHSSGGVPTATTVSGDVTIDSTGNVQIAADKIVNADINSAAAIAASKISGTAITAADTGTVTSTMIADGTIVNADINASAAIAASKISGTAITAADTGTVTSTMIADGTIVNADINASAAIAYSKLNLGTSIVNADIATGAAIAASKISGTAITAADSGTVTSTMIADGTIVNTDINASAAIAYSKLSLSGAITTTDLATGAARSGFRSHIVAQQGATHTIAASDVGGLVVLSSCTSVVIPTADGTFTVGDRIDFLQTGSQVVTFSATAPQTVGGFDSQTKLGGQYAVATLVKYAANTWVLVGNITS